MAATVPGREEMDTCRDVIDLLTEYMEGDLPRDQASGLEAHLGVCPACGEFLATLRTTRAAVGSIRCEDLPADCHRQLRAFLDKRLKAPKG
ncbi:MAG TPA: zf-HC2 domain-containing protein [Candidatus Polarisedimenticolia bacterium]|nr:zf-HC2 domain-containing protein [Candidatus Polarisedimenticolia bacterium]